LELIPEEESQIAQVNQKDLYYPKEYNKIPIGTVPNSISSYNASVKASGNILPQQTTPGITYNLGESSSNSVSTQPQQISSAPATATPTAPVVAAPIAIAKPTMVPVATEHPNIIEEDNEVVHKCKRDAINNSAKIAKETIPSNIVAISKDTFSDTSSDTSSNTVSNFYNTYKMPITIIFVIIILLIAMLIYSSINSNNN
jgi:hypothetical protein